MFGEEITVRAEMVNYTGLSSHADRDHLIAWISEFKAPKPQQVFVVHGDRDVAPFFAETLRGMGFDAHAAQYTEIYDLAANRQIETGYLPERKAKTVDGVKLSAAYERLTAIGRRVAEAISRARGRDNKSVGRFADQLKQVLDKWEA